MYLDLPISNAASDGTARRSFRSEESGFAAAEAVLLALVLCGLSLLVGKILVPGLLRAVKNLNKELAGT